jgi:hypothetical protein
VHTQSLPRTRYRACCNFKPWIKFYFIPVLREGLLRRNVLKTWCNEYIVRKRQQQVFPFSFFFFLFLSFFTYKTFSLLFIYYEQICMHYASAYTRVYVHLKTPTYTCYKKRKKKNNIGKLIFDWSIIFLTFIRDI